jgi:ATP-dependent Clp protease ATP-binding subunit ClpA
VKLRAARRRPERSAQGALEPVVRELLAAAREEALAFRHDSIGTEHVLLALLRREDETGRALTHLGLDTAGVRAHVRRIAGDEPTPGAAFDADALGSIGIDLEAVRERIEASFGEGALDRASRRRGTCGGALGVSPRLKQALERALREAALRGDRPTAADVALGLVLQRESLAADILEAHAISPERLRTALDSPAG